MPLARRPRAEAVDSFVTTAFSPIRSFMTSIRHSPTCRYPKFVADFSQRDSRDPVVGCYLYERLFPNFCIKLFPIPSFHGASRISFAEFPRESIRIILNWE
jgi:hypothetical protein